MDGMTFGLLLVHDLYLSIGQANSSLIHPGSARTLHNWMKVNEYSNSCVHDILFLHLI